MPGVEDTARDAPRSLAHLQQDYDDISSDRNQWNILAASAPGDCGDDIWRGWGDARAPCGLGDHQTSPTSATTGEET